MTPQVKICGLTRVEHALKCADLGANAIGCVFYPKSPRHLTNDRAGEICSAVRDRVKTVGVFGQRILFKHYGTSRMLSTLCSPAARAGDPLNWFAAFVTETFR